MNNSNFSNSCHFQYINSNSSVALIDFNSSFFDVLSKYTNYYNDLIFLCIGTDKTIGDSLAPLIGYKLSNLNLHKKISIYGTLQNSVNSKNLISCVDMIYSKHNNPLIITIDASLGKENLVNYINIGEGSIKPKFSNNKNFPYIGDIFITGIVNSNSNFSNFSNFSISETHALQNTSLFNIIRMSDIITYGIWHCTNNIL